MIVHRSSGKNPRRREDKSSGRTALVLMKLKSHSWTTPTAPHLLGDVSPHQLIVVNVANPHQQMTVLSSSRDKRQTAAKEHNHLIPRPHHLGPNPHTSVSRHEGPAVVGTGGNTDQEAFKLAVAPRVSERTPRTTRVYQHGDVR